MSAFVYKILKEAETTKHFEERLGERFLSKPFLNVGFETGINSFETVGTWELPAQYRTQLIDEVSFLESVKFPQNKSYAVRLFKIRVDMKDVNFFSDEDKVNAQHKPLIVIDDVHTYGDTCYAIIQENKLVSIYFVRSSIQHQFHVDTKLNIDSIKQHLNSKKQLVQN